jgi:hypothetical protein
MSIHVKRFNIYLWAALATVLVCGCETLKGMRKKEVATFELHQGDYVDPAGRSETVTIHRDPLVQISIDKQAFLTEQCIKKAKVIDIVGGYGLCIQYDRRGSWLLEQYTTAGLGRHVVIFSQFFDRGGKQLNEGKWVGAILLRKRITDGMLIFTPDVTREEADQIALGLNNVAKQLGTNSELNQ